MNVQIAKQNLFARALGADTPERLALARSGFHTPSSTSHRCAGRKRFAVRAPPYTASGQAKADRPDEDEGQKEEEEFRSVKNCLASPGGG